MSWTFAAFSSGIMCVRDSLVSRLHNLNDDLQFTMTQIDRVK